MNRILRKIRWIYVSFLTFIIISVPIDTYILGGKIKLWIIAKANTTSASPFSTDGQMNIVIVIVSIIGLMVAVHLLFGREKKKEDADNEDEVIEG